MTVAVLACGALIVILGGSRAALGLFAVGFLLVTLLSMRQKMTGRKAATAAALAALVVCAIPVMLWSVDRRSEAQLQSSDSERGAFIDAARMIIADHPLGIGANQYVVVANLGGYSDRAGVPWNYADRSAPVHNSYYLVTAELGFLGLVGLISMFGAAVWIGLNGLRADGALRSELLVGFIVAVIVLMVHIAFEWVFELAVIQYLTAAAFGMIVGIAAPARLKRSARPKRELIYAGVGERLG
jgi:O-antigen ligase